MSGAAYDNPGGPTRGARFRSALLGLQCKSTVVVVALTLSVAAVVAALFIRLCSRFVHESQEAESVRLCRLFAELAVGPMADNDRGEMVHLAETFATGHPLIFAALCDADDQVLVSLGNDGVPFDPSQLHGPIIDHNRIGTPVHRRIDENAPVFLDVSYPINGVRRVNDPARSALLGYARIGFDFDPTVKTAASIMDLASGAGMAVVLVTVPLAYFAVRRIVVPLDDLSQTAGRLARGVMSARSGIRRNDEIGHLARAFDNMADELALRQQQITTINAELEERVRQRTQQLKDAACRDPLTGLYNRRHSDEALGRCFAEAIRYGTPLSCLMLDLDNFKSVNDRHGHHTGDEVLVLTSLTIAGQLRDADLAARYGGDEFLVLLPQTEAEEALCLGRRIAEHFAVEAATHFPALQLGVSIGVASLSDANVDVPETLVRTADRALYAAKQLGKNRVEFSAVPI